MDDLNFDERVSYRLWENVLREVRENPIYFSGIENATKQSIPVESEHILGLKYRG